MCVCLGKNIDMQTSMAVVRRSIVDVHMADTPGHVEGGPPTAMQIMLG